MCILLIALLLAFTPVRAQESKRRDIRLSTTPSQKIPLSADPNGFDFRDVNGDGFVDLFVAANAGGNEGPAYAFLSRKGRFDDTPSWTPEEQAVYTSVALADFDGDGTDDIFLGCSNGGGSRIHRGRGKGDFDREPFWRADPDNDDGEFGPTDQVIAGDIDGDGDMDIFSGDHGTFRLWRGAKGGPAKKGEPFEKGEAWATRLAWIDMNGDRRRDLVATNYNGPAFEVFTATKDGFSPKPSTEAALHGHFHSLAVADLDADGFPEMAVGSTTFSSGDGRLRLYGNRKGVPTQVPIWTCDDTDVPMNELIFQDLDADGDPDLFVLADDHTAIYENKAGVLATRPCWKASISGNNGFNGHVAAFTDLDNDGWPDLIVAGAKEALIFRGGADVPVVKIGAPPAAPKLEEITRRDLRPEMAEAVEAALDDYRKAESKEARKAAMAKIESAPVEALNAVLAIDEPDLDPLRIALQAEADRRTKKLFPALKMESLADREEAARDLLALGPAALPCLEEAIRSDDVEMASRARTIRDSIQVANRSRCVVAIEVIGLRLARLTPRLRKRYGMDAVEGVVVLAAPGDSGRRLLLGDLREGDVFSGIGPRDDWRKKLTVPRDAIHLLELIALHAAKERRSAAFEWRCGPLHPEERGKSRDGRLQLTEEQLSEIQDLAKKPLAWRPVR